MPPHPGTWARRQAFGIDLTRPGIEDDHFMCAGYYSCTGTGFCDMVKPRMHVWAVIAFEYRRQGRQN